LLTKTGASVLLITRPIPSPCTTFEGFYLGNRLEMFQCRCVHFPADKMGGRSDFGRAAISSAVLDPAGNASLLCSAPECDWKISSSAQKHDSG
jgi:hypothetical protein